LWLKPGTTGTRKLRWGGTPTGQVLVVKSKNSMVRDRKIDQGKRSVGESLIGGPHRRKEGKPEESKEERKEHSVYSREARGGNRQKETPISGSGLGGKNLLTVEGGGSWGWNSGKRGYQAGGGWTGRKASRCSNKGGLSMGQFWFRGGSENS